MTTYQLTYISPTRTRKRTHATQLSHSHSLTLTLMHTPFLGNIVCTEGELELIENARDSVRIMSSRLR